MKKFYIVTVNGEQSWFKYLPNALRFAAAHNSYVEEALCPSGSYARYLPEFCDWKVKGAYLSENQEILSGPYKFIGRNGDVIPREMVVMFQDSIIIDSMDNENVVVHVSTSF